MISKTLRYHLVNFPGIFFQILLAVLVRRNPLLVDRLLLEQ